MELNSFWENHVGKGHRHIVTSMSKSKVKYHRDRFYSHLINHIDTSKVTTSLDWGCGGGILAKELSKFSDVHIVDISQDSINSCLTYVGKDNVSSAQLLLKLSDYKHTVAIDLLHCEAVVHHFPSVAYWKEVAEVWSKINPKYIALQIKYSDNNREQLNYYEGNNYVDGLYLTIDEVLGAFSRYSCVKLIKEKAKSGKNYAFFVLKLKEV